jgi:ferredoxin--NADP+ reductase
MKHICIIGSGPAGCYLADQLLRLIPDASISVLEQLPVPFGLIRYGVAPDHQSTKAVARLFDRVLSNERVSFFGNVCVGRDVSLEELLSLYDAVVLATGAPLDRRLGIPGEDLPGVMGSGAFVGWYNEHPHHELPQTKSVRSAIVIGNGNVASDVVRVLAKSKDELAGSDLSAEVTEWLSSQPLEEIHVVGRRGAADAKFTDHELAELGTLTRARPVVNAGDLSGDTAVVKTLREFADAPAREAQVAIRFHFHLTPAAFLGDGKLEAVRFRTATGDTLEIPAQLAVTCIGYEALACDTLAPANGVFVNDEGRIGERLYVAGWAKRGPTGTIPTNRTEAQQLAKKMAGEIADGGRLGEAELLRLLAVRGASVVDYQGWHRIDAAELAAAVAGRCRNKLRSTDAMRAAAGIGELHTA